MNDTDRLAALRQWLSGALGEARPDLVPASGDASFRRYFRFSDAAGSSRIVMDAPPETEDCGPFLSVSERLLDMGLNVPRILASDPERGFILMSDLGNRHYLDALDADTVERLYGDALGALAVIQSCGPREGELPAYDRDLLLAEMGLFRDWLLETHLGLVCDPGETEIMVSGFELLAESALSQPAVCVHRDYHSRNLMVTSTNNPGILDYQDAVIGPVTYDLVSLLRDCYIRWPRNQVEEWALGYRELAHQSGILQDTSEDEFLRWFDLMGVQRHLKAAGIFARLQHRDGKPGYLGDIPRTLGYVVEVCATYPEFERFGRLISDRVLPALEQRAGSQAVR